MRGSPLVLAAAGVILAMMAACVLVLVAQRRGAAWVRRVEATLGGVRTGPIEPPSALSRLGARLRRRPELRRAAALLGMRLEHVGEYQPRWFVVLALALGLGRVAGGIAGDAFGDMLVLPVTLAAFLVFSRMGFAMLDARRRETLFRQFPDALGQITRAVRVGIPVVEAIRQVASEAPVPTSGEFRAISDRLVFGMPLDEALADTAMRTGVPEYSFFSTALSLQARTGGGLADTLDNLADVIRKRVALKERGRALASEARTSAAILAALPFVTCGMLAVVNPSYVAVLLTTENGKIALGLAATLLTTGLLSMRFIIRKALS